MYVGMLLPLSLGKKILNILFMKINVRSIWFETFFGFVFPNTRVRVTLIATTLRRNS